MLLKCVLNLRVGLLLFLLFFTIRMFALISYLLSRSKTQELRKKAGQSVNFPNSSGLSNSRDSFKGNSRNSLESEHTSDLASAKESDFVSPPKRSKKSNGQYKSHKHQPK